MGQLLASVGKIILLKGLLELVEIVVVVVVVVVVVLVVVVVVVVVAWMLTLVLRWSWPRLLEATQV